MTRASRHFWVAIDSPRLRHRLRALGTLTVGCLLVAACTDAADSASTSSAATTTLSSTTAPPSATTTLVTTAPSSTTSTTAVPTIEVVATTGWELREGDVLVSDEDNVRQYRNGVEVAIPVSSPTRVAIADGLGGIVLQPIEAGPLSPEYPPSGALELWRVTPDGEAALLYRSDADRYGTVRVDLFDVVFVEPLSQAPSVLFTEARCIGGAEPYCNPQDVLLALPLDACGEPVVIAAPVGSFEGSVGGVAWQPDPGRFLISMWAEGAFWMSAWDVEGSEVPWAENPNPRVASGPSHAFIFSMVKVKGRNQIVYAQSPTDDWWGAEALDLVFYDTGTGRETARLPIAGRPFLHAGTLSIAVTSTTWTQEEGEVSHHVGIVDLTTGRVEYPGFRGRASIVTELCCSPPVCILPTPGVG